MFSADIVDGQVKAVDLGNGAVTVAKLADGSITGGKIADGSIQGRDVLDNNLKGADIDESTLSDRSVRIHFVGEDQETVLPGLHVAVFCRGNPNRDIWRSGFRRRVPGWWGAGRSRADHEQPHRRCPSRVADHLRLRRHDLQHRPAGINDQQDYCETFGTVTVTK